ncbi:MAG: alpha/beta hydrolase [Alphaproteobacteria bacterium]|nr:alpha/beta hydrolase [Alphaproteobacteria bacterium]
MPEHGRHQDGLLKWPDLLERERPEPDASIRYGREVNQLVDLWLPATPATHPVVLMVHGGCWQSDVADRRIMNWIADDLRRRGIAVWNIEYRGVDRKGGGYPGTFHDVAAAADALRDRGPRHGLDLSRIVAVGHSAGGHLALWLAARHRLPADSPLRAAEPLAIHFVLSLGGLPDLEEAARPPGSGCGVEVIERLTRGRFDDTSIPRLAPLGVEQLLIDGREDRIIPSSYAESYAARMRKAGDEVTVRMMERTGHIELIAPESAAWTAAAAAIERAFGR